MNANDTDAVRIVVTEGEAFYQRNVDNLGHGAAFLGGMTMGLLRAIAECPNCPGVSRMPQDEEWDTLICPRCKGVWVKRDGEQE